MMIKSRKSDVFVKLALHFSPFSMPTSFFHFEMLPTTWLYVSALMILAIFFRFNRFLSIRNFDLILLIALGPGLLFLAMYDNQWGYVWIFGVHILLFFRLICDTLMVRRPLLEPNLTPAGLTFACVTLLAFMVANITVNRGEQVDSARTVRLEQIFTLASSSDPEHVRSETMSIPGYRPFLFFVERTNRMLGASPDLLPQLERRKPGLASRKDLAGLPRSDGAEGLAPPKIEPISVASDIDSPKNADLSSPEKSTVAPAPRPAEPLNDIGPEPVIDRPLGSGAPSETEANAFSSFAITVSLSTVILAHLMIVFGFVYIGHCHFGNLQTGIAAATIYLLLPYTNQMIGRIDHFIPGALILWAVAFYRRPIFSGTLIALAAGLVFYPIFLVPLWCGFYWKRGWIRFLSTFCIVFTLFGALLFWTPAEYGSFADQLGNLFGKSCFLLENPDGVWETWTPFYRIPIIALYLVFCLGMILWPSHKHLAVLISCSGIMMLGTQFWQSHEGGLYMVWYLPFVILTMFRPNLEDRVAQTTVVELKYFF